MYRSYKNRLSCILALIFNRDLLGWIRFHPAFLAHLEHRFNFLVRTRFVPFGAPQFVVSKRIENGIKLLRAESKTPLHVIQFLSHVPRDDQDRVFVLFIRHVLDECPVLPVEMNVRDEVHFWRSFVRRRRRRRRRRRAGKNAGPRPLNATRRIHARRAPRTPRRGSR